MLYSKWLCYVMNARNVNANMRTRTVNTLIDRQAVDLAQMALLVSECRNVNANMPSRAVILHLFSR